jgi:hypothetical protein
VEVAKSQSVLNCIEAANKIVKELCEDVGLPDWEFSPDKIRLLPDKETFTEITGGKGVGRAMKSQQEVFILWERFMVSGHLDIVLLSHVLLHELLHIAGYTVDKAVLVNPKKIVINPKRWGASVYVGTASEENFTELGVGFLEGTIENTVCDQFEKMVDMIAEKDPNIKTVYLDPKTKHVFGYPGNRTVLDFTVSEIQKNNPKDFPNTDSVKKLFRKLHFLGETKTLALEVNKVFGRTGFKVLMSMSETEESAKQTKTELLKLLETRPKR